MRKMRTLVENMAGGGVGCLVCFSSGPKLSLTLAILDFFIGAKRFCSVKNDVYCRGCECDEVRLLTECQRSVLIS